MSPKDGTNESIDALPAACTTMDAMKEQGAATAAGKVSRKDPPESENPLENLSTFHARVICASRAADAAIV